MTKSDDFAAAMQELSAEAQKALSAAEVHHAVAAESAFSHFAQEMRVLNARLENLEQTVENKIANPLRPNATGMQPGLTDHLRLMEEQLSELVTRDGATQKMFDSLHAELINYRDNFVHETLQRPFIHDLVLLFDDLTALAKQLETSNPDQKQRGQAARWHDNLQNAIHSLMEILHRLDVKEVETKEMFDRAIHRVVCYEPAEREQEDGQVVARVRRGFIWRGKLIRPEEVIVKKFEQSVDC